MTLGRLELPAFDEPTWRDVDETFGRNPGIYRVLLKTVELDGYEPITRLLGVDLTGLLYIGMSDAIIDRFGALRTGIWGAYKFESSTGRVYANPAVHKIGLKMLRGFAKAITRQRLFIEVEGYPKGGPLPQDYDVRKHESDAIGDYCRHFGEPPPFNDSWGSDLPLPTADD